MFWFGGFEAVADFADGMDEDGAGGVFFDTLNLGEDCYCFATIWSFLGYF